VQARLRELEHQQVVLSGELAEIRTRRRELEAEPIDIDDAMELVRRFSELFAQATAEEKEALADALLRSATVDEDKSVEFEFYVGADPGSVVQDDKFGSPEGIRGNDHIRGHLRRQAWLSGSTCCVTQCVASVEVA